MKPITIENCACVVGRLSDSRHSPWIVREPVTGLAVSNVSDSREEAIADATAKIRAAGGAEVFRSATLTAQPRP